MSFASILNPHFTNTGQVNHFRNSFIDFTLKKCGNTNAFSLVWKALNVSCVHNYFDEGEMIA